MTYEKLHCKVEQDWISGYIDPSQQTKIYININTNYSMLITFLKKHIFKILRQTIFCDVIVALIL